MVTTKRPAWRWAMQGVSDRCRRRPTLPRPLGRSTIGAVGLNDRVRDGNGCGPYALVASESSCANATCANARACGAVHPSVVADGRTKKESEGQRMLVRGIWIVPARCAGAIRCEAYSAVYSNGSSQAARAIRTAALGVPCGTSTGGLSTGWSPPALQEAQGLVSVHLGACFPLRCIQRLSQPIIATRRCSWRNSRDTSGSSDSVLSY